jgi:phosphomannomutase
MNPTYPRIIIFDLDGTLTESKQRMGAELSEALTALTKTMPVAIMSGASYRQFERQFLDALPAEANLKHIFIFPDNAAQCFVYVDGKWRPQYDHAFSIEEKARISQALAEAVAEIGIPIPSKVWGERIEDRGAEIAFSALGQDAPLEAKEQWHKMSEPLRDALVAALQKKLPDFSISEGGLTTIQITRKGITKAYGIHRLTELTHIPVAEMLYVGDAVEENGNDAVVAETGIRTHAVFGPKETAALIETFLHKAPQHH